MYVDPKEWLQVVADLRTYYETDIDNCLMNNDDWIREIAFAILDRDYQSDFYTRFNQYKKLHSE